MESLLQAIKRVERKLDTVIRAIYEHDEDIQDEYGRSQRTIDAGHRDKAEDQAGDLLGECNESSLQREEEPRAPIANRSSEREANPPRNNGKVQREEPISRGNGENQNVSRENGASKHASSKSNATRQHHSRGGRQRGSNGNTQGANR